MTFRYCYTSTIDDILNAQKANWRGKTGIRGAFRILITILSVGFLAGGILFWGHTENKMQPIIWLVMGGVIFLIYVVKPFLQCQRIRKQNPKEQSLTLCIDDEGIKVEAQSVGNLVRRWDEIGSIQQVKEGLLFHFKDGIVNLLPKRVFQRTNEAAELLKFIHVYLKKEEGSR